MTVPPRLSVIVPLQGPEEHFEECLRSLRDQTLPDIEVVIVRHPRAVRDQDAKAVRDLRFRVVTAATLDVGAARNTGVAHATGAFLAFAGSDAVIPADAYRALVESLENTGSDLACGKAARIAVETAGRHLAGTTVLRTHITKQPTLLQDTSVTNKVFRRAFWDEHGFAFPEGLREDFPVTIPAHVRSRSTDVLNEVVCLGRADNARSADPGRRLAAMLEVSGLLAEHAPELKRRYDRQLAEHGDLVTLLGDASIEGGVDRLLELAPELADLDPEAGDTLPVLGRLTLFLAARGRADELRKLQRFARTDIRDSGVVRRRPALPGLPRPRWYLDYPFRGDRGVPDHLYEADRDFEPHARVDDVRHCGGMLRVEGHAYIAHLESRRSHVGVWLQRGDDRIDVPIRRVSRPDVTADSGQSAVCHDDSGFVAEIDPTRLQDGRWALHAEVSARGITRSGRFAAGRSAGERKFPAGGVRVTLTEERGLTLTSGRPAEDSGCHPDDLAPCSGAEVTGVRWTEAHDLVLTGVGLSRTDTIVLRHARTAERHTWPLHLESAGGGQGRWAATIGRTEQGLPLRSGTWRVFCGDERLRLRARLVGDLPEPHTTGLHEVSFRTTLARELILVVRPALHPDERGRYATRRRGTSPQGSGTSRQGSGTSLQRRVTSWRPAGRLWDAAFFDSYGGGQYSCNPRAVSEELGRRRPDMELIWVTRDGQFTVPAGVRTVLYGSREHEQALRSCRFVVANRRTQPSWYAKRPGQMFVQTWHGTPLKRLGRDIAGMPYAQRDLDEDLERYAAMWDLMVSPSPFATPILRGAFGYRGEMLESGYPRTDVLFRPGRDRWVRRRLSIPEDRRVILYAPTWRDDELTGRRRLGLELDVGRAVEALGLDDVLLVRTHYLVADRMTIPPGVIDVSRFPDMADLLAATDVLITDYSSAMFDFACTGRPMVFFTYDLERYRDEVRGFYFDFEEEAPGPIVRNSDEVIEALKYADATPYKVRYQDFSDKFCPWDDGHASERVVGRMLA
ncbi:CDP-glycerol glycerophosphotransferase family protein [Planotetraspora sp. GP83]|uniref:bifunctional glycosyltransferase/CDP-glycerol:glycerophosphate glycerophosphotransferase n=1 Tax=Planotetraspora sp. GP83 TaxID=3156264 RepID=UPI00351154A0